MCPRNMEEKRDYLKIKVDLEYMKEYHKDMLLWWGKKKYASWKFLWFVYSFSLMGNSVLFLHSISLDPPPIFASISYIPFISYRKIIAKICVSIFLYFKNVKEIMNCNKKWNS